jgi:hypothetical protein
MRKQLESVFVKYFGREGSKRLVSYLELVCRKPGRADSVHPVEKLCSFYHLGRHPSARAGMGGRGGSAVGAKYIVRGRKDTTQTVLNIERAQGCCPWSPPQEGARGQSSFARRGLPSKGEARALHHQPAPEHASAEIQRRFGKISFVTRYSRYR